MNESLEYELLELLAIAKERIAPEKYKRFIELRIMLQEQDSSVADRASLEALFQLRRNVAAQLNELLTPGEFEAIFEMDYENMLESIELINQKAFDQEGN